MLSRRQFLKNAALLSGAVGFWETLESPIAKALAIEPDPASTYLDAEHIVILMQENRSFDHCYGTLQGVRGYNDPRAITLPDSNPVWVQTNAAGQSYAPFRLNIHDTKATWMGFLPHNWASQVDARNDGKHDQWLQAKRSGHKEYADMPLTMGHYTRQDIPFYYALADAFTVCDQHFCSSITPTLPNRLYYWTGTVREHPDMNSPAMVRNEQIMQNNWSSGWTTFPERLEDAGVSWKIYQNELMLDSGLSKDEVAWLANFGCNVMEYYPQYNVKFAKGRRDYLQRQSRAIAAQIDAIKNAADQDATAQDNQQQLQNLTTTLQQIEQERAQYSQANFDNLSPRERSLHEKAFCTNIGDPSYRQLAEMAYHDGPTQRNVLVPKGDAFHQFRQDVKSGNLPAVSWLVAPERLSDHPESAWYGAWYISEAVKILTDNPEVWKKTIFILTYDENDGYFDHVPPFVAPRPGRRETGFSSKGVDSTLEYVELEQDQKLNLKGPRQSPIGLGYRVPLVVASPWSRGGCVCSQVFDNTSVLQFLETFLTQKTGKPIKETNLSSWRRTICGDLSSIFQPAPAQKDSNPQFLARDPLVQQIYQAQFKPLPSGFHALSKQDIDQLRQDPIHSPHLPRQEPGIRRSCPLPYELYVHGSLSGDRSHFTISFRAARDRFADRSAGAPFTVYARTAADVIIRNYAVAAGDQLQDSWPIADFPAGAYHLHVAGPNGFLREFIGGPTDPLLDLQIGYTTEGGVQLKLVNSDSNRPVKVRVADRSYKAPAQTVSIAPGAEAIVRIDTSRSFRWYDSEVTIDTIDGDGLFRRRLAGRVETGQWTMSDPAMGGVVT